MIGSRSFNSSNLVLVIRLKRLLAAGQDTLDERWGGLTGSETLGRDAYIIPEPDLHNSVIFRFGAGA